MKIKYSPEIEKLIEESKAKLTAEQQKNSGNAKHPEKQIDCNKLSTNKRQYSKIHRELGM